MLTVKFTPNDRGNPPGKLADVELHFVRTDQDCAPGSPLADARLDGLKLIGFAIWETRARRNVTFPARVYSVNGERRSFALLRPIVDVDAQNRLRDYILQQYAEYEAAQDAEHYDAVRNPAPIVPSDLKF